MLVWALLKPALGFKGWIKLRLTMGLLYFVGFCFSRMRRAIVLHFRGLRVEAGALDAVLVFATVRERLSWQKVAVPMGSSF